MRRTVLRNDSRIHSWAYDEAAQILQIKYWADGRVFNYHDVWPAYVVLVFEGITPGPDWEQFRTQFREEEVRDGS
jgi:hypothetical protein